MIFAGSGSRSAGQAVTLEGKSRKRTSPFLVPYGRSTHGRHDHTSQ